MRLTFIRTKLIIIYLIPFILFSPKLSAQNTYNLLSWDFGGKSGQTTVAATHFSGGISTTTPSGVAKLGTGVYSGTWYTGNGLTGTGTVETLAEAITKNKYISFTIVPNQTLTIKSIHFVPISQNQTRKFAVFSSINGFSEANVINTISAVNTNNKIEKTNITGHENLSSAIEFRIYIYGVNDAYEVYGLGDRSSDQSYDLAIEGFIPDNEKPSAPSNLTAKNIKTSYFELLWDASTDNLGVTEYLVYKNQELIGTTSGNSLTITNLTKNTSYSMAVRAKDAQGNISDLSNSLQVTTAAEISEKNNIGINVSHFADWSGDHAFADVMRLARVWYKGTDWGITKAAIDAKGWPTEDANLCVWHGIDKMNGTYKMKFTGKANSIVADWGNASISNIVYSEQTNTTTADLVYTSTDGAGLRLIFAGTNGGIKDLKLMRPVSPGSTTTYDFNTVFTTPFKNMLDKFTTIRFLNWLATNGSPDSIWNERIKEDYYMGSWGRNVADWETIIKLCNETGKDAWINIPVKANDDYIQNLAVLFKTKLNQNIKLYIEFSNEVWNTAPGFPQSFINHDAAKAEYNLGNSSLAFDGTTNTWFMAWRRVAKKTVEISNIFRNVFGDSEMMTRVRPVLMWQPGNAQSTGENQLLWLDYYSEQTGKPINYYIYGAGASGYYSPDLFSDNLTLENIWTSETMDVNNWAPLKKADAFYISAMGCKSLVYEGGTGFDDTGHSEDIKLLALNDSRITQSIKDHHRLWRSYGGDLFCYYRSTGDKQWGFAEDIYNLNTKKYDAINDLNNEDQFPVTLGASIPGTLEGRMFDMANPSWKQPGQGSHKLDYKGNWTGYLFHTNEIACKISVEYSNAQNATIQIIVDGIIAGEQNINGSGTVEIIKYLQAGLHNVRIKQKNETGFEIIKISFDEANIYLTASTNYIELPATTSNSQTFDIKSNVNWNITSDQNWLTFNKNSGNNDETITLLASENSASASRTALVTISSDNLPNQIITVTQNGSTTNIKRIEYDKEIVFPNPATDRLYFKIDNYKDFTITDISGKIVFRANSFVDNIDISDFKKGIYTITFTQEDKILVNKFVKQ